MECRSNYLLTLLVQFFLWNIVQNSPCTKLWTTKADLSYSYDVDCSNRGLETVPTDIPDMTTKLLLNGNRLEKLSTKDFANLEFLQQLDLSGNDLTTLDKDVFKGIKQLYKLDLRRNRLNCDWSVWWLANFSRTLDEFYGYCFSPPSLRGREIKSLEESDVIVDCVSKSKLHPNAKDGEVIFRVAGNLGRSINVPIYCHGMEAGKAGEFLTLPSGSLHNFAKFNTFDYKENSCKLKADLSGLIGRQRNYFRIRIDLKTLSVLTDDATFASGGKNGCQFGTAGLCLTGESSCLGGTARIDLRGTPFKVKASTTWVAKQKIYTVSVVRKFEGTVLDINCTSACGGCYPEGGLKLDVIDKQDSPFVSCTLPLGMQSGLVKDSNITASTSVGPGFLPHYGRLFERGDRAWCAGVSDQKQYLEIDLGTVNTVSGISTQGYRALSDWVTKYRIQYSEDNTTWTYYQELGFEKIFTGNFDSETVITHWLQPRLRARFIRVNPLSWYNADFLEHRICLRMELYGCKSDTSSFYLKLKTSCLIAKHHIDAKQLNITATSQCVDENALYKMNNQGQLIHTKSGYCMDFDKYTLVLKKSCESSRLLLQRITRPAPLEPALILKSRQTGKCAKFHYSGKSINIQWQKCSGVGFDLLIVSRKGTLPVKPTFNIKEIYTLVSIGDSVTFPCIANGDPLPLYRWWKKSEDKEVPVTDAKDIEVSKNSTLIFHNITWQDRGVYYCYAYNSHGSSAFEVRLGVRAIQRFLDKPMNNLQLAGSTVMFHCRVTGIPDPKISWKRILVNDSENIQFIETAKEKFRQYANGTLVISRVENEDEGRYYCEARSPGLVQNVSATLTVHVPPKITISSKRESILVNQTVSVRCKATGDPTPTVKWYKLPQGSSSKRTILSSPEGELRIHRATKMDVGIYICEATSASGIAKAELSIEVTAICLFNALENSIVSPNKAIFLERESVRISCAKGFKLLGSRSLTCTSSGLWNRLYPLCRDIDECREGLSPGLFQSGSGMDAVSSTPADDEPDVCHINALCTNTYGSYKCTCEEGYLGNGFKCVWSPTTTKLPTTTLGPVTTSGDLTSPGTSTKLHSSTALMTSPPLSRDSAMKLLIQNYTDGTVTESDLLRGLLMYSFHLTNENNVKRKSLKLATALEAQRAVVNPLNKLRYQKRSFSNLETFVNVASNLLDKRNHDAWVELQKDMNGSVEVMELMETYSNKFMEEWEKTKQKPPMEIVSKNLVLKIQGEYKQGSSKQMEMSISDENVRVVKISLPLANSSEDDTGSAVVVGIYYKTLQKLLPRHFDFKANRTSFPAQIVSVSSNTVKEGTTLYQPLKLEFLQGGTSEIPPNCAFWDFNISGSGGWSERGCRISMIGKRRNGKRTVECECNHLTNFGLIDNGPIINKRDGDGAGLYILSVSLAVIIGCAFCIFLSLLTCMGHVCCPNGTGADRRIILLNVCVSLILGLMLFLGGILLPTFKLIKLSFEKWFCLALSGALQLCFLAFFSWMLAEAIHLFLSTRTVIDKGSGKLKYFYLLGWGFPTFMVTCTVILLIFNHIRISSWCWLDLSSFTMLVLFGAPTGLLLLITITLYILIMQSLNKNKDLLNANIQMHSRCALKCSCLLLFFHVMTLTSIAAFLAFNHNVIFHYLFAGASTAEGIFLITYHCYLEKKLSPLSSPKTKAKKRQHTYSTQDTITYGTNPTESEGKYLIKRPSKRNSIEYGPKTSSRRNSKQSDRDLDWDSHYPDMYGSYKTGASSANASPRVPLLPSTKEEKENAHESDYEDSAGNGPTTDHAFVNTSVVSNVSTNDEDRHQGPSSHRPSRSGSVVSVETHGNNSAAVQCLPVYFPSAPPHHEMTLERKRKEVIPIPKDKVNNKNPTDRESFVDADRLSNISLELTNILHELEAFDAPKNPPTTNTFNGPKHRPREKRDVELRNMNHNDGGRVRVVTRKTSRQKDMEDGLHGDAAYSSL